MKARKTSAFKLENLEPRLLFSSGTTVAAVECEVMPVDSGAVLQLDLASEAESAEHADMQSLSIKELVLIDGSVDDPLHLIEELQSPNDENQQYAYHILDSQKDGVEQVSEILERYQGVSAVHLISHGTDGELLLGNSTLTSDNISQYAAQIQGWQGSLTEQADFLFYGCNLAKGDTGHELLTELSRLTGADIAASEDLTGQAALGGDWDLEYRNGVINTSSFDAKSMQNWNGLLATITVTQTADVVNAPNMSTVSDLNTDSGGDGISLREAIIAANSDPDADEIILPAGTYTLTLTGTAEDLAANLDLDILADITITGTADGQTVIDGGGLDRVLDVRSGTVTLSGLTLQNGSAALGGAIDTQSATNLILQDVRLTANNATNGGGAILVRGSLNLDGVLIDNNMATNNGGGIRFTNHSSGTIVNSTLSGNQAGVSGGALHNFNSSIDIVNSTIAFNEAVWSGGGINIGGGGSVTLHNTILSENTGGNVSGGVTSLGYNIDSDGTAGISNTGDQSGTVPSPLDVKLAALADNGGPTLTHALGAGSVAIDAGDNSVGLAEDQRGISRPIDGDGDSIAIVDIGAFEVKNVIATFNPNQDTYLNKGSDTTNYGSDGELWVDKSGGGQGDIRTLLQFDLNSIPSGSVISSATLVMEATAMSGGNFPIEVFKVTQTWDENTATWINSPTIDDTTVVASFTPTGLGQHDWDITSLVQSWIDDSPNNFGLMIGSEDGGGDSFTYASSESGGTQPQLVVNYIANSNSAPTGGYSTANVIPAAQISQSTDGSGAITINWKATDAASDSVTLHSFEYSDNGGVTWYSPLNNDASGAFSSNWNNNGGSGWSTDADFASAPVHSFTFNTQHVDVTGTHSLDGVDQSDIMIRFVVNDGTYDSAAPVQSEAFRLDNEKPTPVITSSYYRFDVGRLVIEGFDFNTVAPDMTDIKSYLDWSKLVINVNSDSNPGNDITFDGSGVATAILADDGKLRINLTAAKEAAVESNPDFFTPGPTESLEVAAGFFADDFGNRATTDGTISSPPTAINLTASETYTEDTLLNFVNDIEVNDSDGGSLTVTLTLSDPAAGTLSTGTILSTTSSYDAISGIWSATGPTGELNALLAALTFDPTLNYASDFNIDTVVTDGISAPLTGVITMTAQPVNDAPTLTSSGNDPTFSEGGTAAVLFSGTSVDTVESGQSFSGLALTVSNVSDGSDEKLNFDGSSVALTDGNSGTTLTNGLSYSVSLSGGTATISLSGGSLSTAATEALVDGLSYQNNSNTPNTSSRVVTLTSLVDSGGTANSGVDTGILSVASTVTVQAVNDQLDATNLNQTRVYSEGAALVTLNTIVVSDADAAGGELITVTLTLNDPNYGSLTVSGGATYASGTGVWTITDTVANVNAALASVSFVPTLNNDLDTSISVDIADGGEDGTVARTGTINLNVIAANDAPTITGTSSAQPVNDKATLSPFSSLVIEDVDSNPVQNLTVIVSLDDAAKGGFSVLNGFADNGDGSYTFVGTASAATSAIRGLVFDPSENRVVAGLTETTTLTISVDDTVAAPVINNSTTVVSTSMNDGPSLVANNPLSVPEEATRTITAAFLQTTDPDHPAAQIVYTLTALPAGGTVRLNGSALGLGGTFTQDDINTGKVTYRDADEGSSAAFKFIVGDGTISLPEATFSINGQPINDAPVVLAPGSNLAATEQVALAIQGAGFSVTDADAASDPIRATLTVDEGSLSVVVGNSGVVVVSGDGTSAVVLTGSIAQLNALLSGASSGSISYLNSSDNPSATTTLTLTANDQGNNGSDPGLTGDASSEEGSASVTIDITAENDRPSASGSYVMADTSEDITSSAVQVGAILGSVAITSSDPDGDTLGIAVFALNGNGTWQYSTDAASWTSFGTVSPNACLLLSETSWIRYVPDGSNAELAAFDFRAWDQTAGTASVNGSPNFGDSAPGLSAGAFSIGGAKVEINVTAINDAPVLVNNNLAISEGQTVVLDSSMLSATDVDNLDSGLTFNVGPSSHGNFVRVSSGLVMTNFTQTDLVAGDVSFVHDGSEFAPTYSLSVTDGSSSSSQFPANIAFTNLNDQPSVGDVNLATTEDGSSVNGSFAVSDPDATDNHSFSITSSPSEGSVVNNNDGTFTFDPGSDFQDLATGETRDVTFTYTAIDDSGAGNATSTSATVTITVTGTNDQPSVSNVSISATEDGSSVTGSFTVTDADSTDNHSFSITSSPSEGSVVNNNDGTFTFDPGSDFQDLAAGETRDVTFAYTATDDSGAGNAASASATVTITVTGSNDQPTVSNVAIAATEDGSTVTGNFAATDTDTTDGHTFTITGSPSEGSVVNNNDGTFTFNPGTDFQDLAVGENRDVSFNYTATDNSGAGNATSTSATVTITVTGTNDQPTVSNVNIAATEDGSSVTGSFAVSDTDTNDSHTFNITSSPSEGSVVNNNNGTFTFDPGTDFQNLADGETRNVTFTYTATDDSGAGNATSTSATVTITVTGTNDQPSVSNVAIAATEDGSTVTGNFVVTDSDTNDGHTITFVGSPAEGTVINNNDGTFSFDPGSDFQDLAAGETRDVTITYFATDSSGAGNADSAVGTVTVTVAGANDQPSAISLDNMNVSENVNGAAIGNLSTTDADTTDTHSYAVDDVRFEVIGNLLKLKIGQSLDRETGATVDINITSTDTNGLSRVQLFTITVDDANELPITADDNLLATEDTALTFEAFAGLIANDSDPEGDSLSLVSFTQPDNGSLVNNGDGTLTYTPDANYFGPDSFEYTIEDAAGNGATGRAFIDIKSVGDTPRVANITTTAGVQSELIKISRHTTDSSEVTHFKISGITGGQLYLADGTAEIHNGDYISVAQGQAGLRFTPDAESAAGSFKVEASEDGSTVSAQSGVAVSIITVNPVVTDPDPGPGPDPDPGEIIEEETSEEVTEEESTEDDTAPAATAEVTANPEIPKADEKGESKATNSFLNSKGDRLNLDGFVSELERVFSETGSAVRELQILVDKTSFTNLLPSIDVDVPTLSTEVYNLVHKTFDAIEGELAEDAKVEQAVIITSLATSFGLSAGYVVWMLQGGTLLTSVLASMPAWQLADPLSILAGNKLDEEDDESLENIIEKGTQDDDESPPDEGAS